MGLTVDDFIAARWYYEGRQRPVRLGVLHATQSPERKHAARGVARDFATRPSTNKASAHIVVDDAETIGCVKPEDTAFAVPSANADGFHIEQVGYSEQQLLDWQDEYSQRVIARAAAVAREASDLFDLPRVWLTVAEVRDGARGWTDHATCSKALGGTHWDPGPDYPRDQFMALLTASPEEDDLTPEEHMILVNLQQRALTPEQLDALVGPKDGLYAALNDRFEKLDAKVEKILKKLGA